MLSVGMFVSEPMAPSEVRMNRVQRVHHVSWPELNYMVSLSRQQFPRRRIWSLMREQPISEGSIDALLWEGWSVFPKKLPYWGLTEMDSHRVNGQRKKCNRIFLKDELYHQGGYARDVTLWHEIVHAVYPRIDDSPGTRFAAFHLCVVDWLARLLCEDQDLTRYALQHFLMSQGSVQDYEQWAHLRPTRFQALLFKANKAAYS